MYCSGYSVNEIEYCIALTATGADKYAFWTAADTTQMDK